VTVLADPSHVDAVLDLLFSETTTLGVRRHDVAREVLDRGHRAVETAYGVVSVKLGWRKGRLVNVAPEFEDCVRLAGAHGVPVKDVLGAAMQAWRAAAGPQGLSGS
jgi:uncharacterized protein (DUF111 family)